MVNATKADSGGAYRVESIQALRGIAVLMVLFYHIGVYGMKASNITLIGQVTDMGKAGVDVFFVISGFIMLSISSQPGRGEEHAASFLLKRAARIYPLYWFYTGIALVIFAVRPDLANRSGGVAGTSILRSILLLPDSGGAPIVGQGWTLIHEMYFYIIFSVILFFGRKARYPLIIGWAIAVASVSYLWKPTWNSSHLFIKPFCDLAFNPLTLEFIGGCLIAYITAHGCHRLGKTSFGLGALLLLIGGIPIHPSGEGGVRELSVGIPAVLLVYGAITMERVSGFTLPRFFSMIGDASYSIYLSHILSLSACLFIWRFFKFDGLTSNISILMIMAAISLIVGFISYRFIEIPIQRHCRSLMKRCYKP